MNRTLKAAVMMAVLALSMAMSSCSNDDALLQSSIPANSIAVASVDGEKLLKAFDVKIEDGKVVLPESMAGSLGIDQASMETMGMIAGNVKYESLYIVFSKDHNAYTTCEVKDAAKIGEALVAEGLEKTDASGFDAAYSGDDISVLIRDKQLWVMPRQADKAADFISEQIKMAESDNFSKIPGVSDMLAQSDNMVKAVYRMGGLMSFVPMTAEATQCWNYMTADVKDNALVFNTGAFNAEGDKVSPKGMEKIDTNFLRYLPSECNIVFALGISKDMDWDGIFKQLEVFNSLQWGAVLNMLKPYLRAIDGTVAFGCGINDPVQLGSAFDVNPAELPVFAMIQMSQEKVNEAVTTLLDMLKQGGIPYQQLSNGVYSITSGDIKLNFGAVNGALAISTCPLKADSGSSLTQTFEGKYFAASIVLPSLDTFSLPMRYGVDIKMSSAGDNTKIVVKLTGTTEAIIPALFSGMAAIGI